MPNRDEHSVTPAVRLIFEYEGDDVRMVSQQSVDVTVSGVDLAETPYPGHYVEGRNESDEPLSRIPVHEAFSTSAEVFPERPGQPITRVDLPEPKGAFTVVVPAEREATNFVLLRVLHRPQPEPAAPGARVPPELALEREIIELARFPRQTRGRPSDEHR